MTSENTDSLAVASLVKSHWRQFLVALAVIIPTVGYPIWALFDRQPPYIRESGVIVASDPVNCGLPKNAPRGIIPGGCITVEWKIKTLRRCEPDTTNNITRFILDGDKVRWNIGPVAGLIGTKKDPNNKPLVRHFLIPSGARPGPAIYGSVATFACNPLQDYLPMLFWPIRVDKPDVPFVIESP